jgi:ribose/xylose/arabinose/galactoside ABC-type transport system permease subunit
VEPVGDDVRTRVADRWVRTEGANMSEDDSTVRLPGRRSDGNRYPDDLPDQGFGYGGDYPSDDPTFDPGYATPESDRTLTLPGQPPPGALLTPPPPPASDRLLVHVVWELLLAVLVAALALVCWRVEPAMFHSAGVRAIAVQAAALGLLAMAVSVSLRAGAPNLAVGAFAAVAGLLFARAYEHDLPVALVPGLGVALVAGLALGVLVALLHVPGWAASLAALCGGLVATTLIGHGTPVTVADGAPDPHRWAYVWFIAVAATSVLAGVFGLIRPLRRAIGAFRPVADPAERRGPGAARMVVLALTVSGGLAGLSGVLTAVQLRTAGGSGSMLPQLLLALGAVLVGGVSAYGRRGGVFGTMFGVLALVLAVRFGTLRGWSGPATMFGVAGGAIVLGLVVTRLVEWGGRRRETRMLGV